MLSTCLPFVIVILALKTIYCLEKMLKMHTHIYGKTSHRAPLFVQIDAPYAERYKACYRIKLDQQWSSLVVLLLLKVIQDHPDSGRFWEEHTNIIPKLKFTTTTHDHYICLPYYLQWGKTRFYYHTKQTASPLVLNRKILLSLSLDSVFITVLASVIHKLNFFILK